MDWSVIGSCGHSFIVFARDCVVQLRYREFRLFAEQEPREKRRLLNFLLSNYIWEDGKVVATFHQAFDMLAETATAAARVEAGESAKSAKSEIWLREQDSNLRPSG